MTNTNKSKKKNTPPDVIVDPIIVNPESKKNNVRQRITYKITEHILRPKNAK